MRGQGPRRARPLSDMPANHAREGSEIPVTDATLPGPPWWSQSPLDASSLPVHTALLFALSALPDGHGLLAQPSRCSDCRNPLSQPAVQAVVDVDIDIDCGDQTRQPYLISSAAHQRPSIVVHDDATPARYRCRLSFFCLQHQPVCASGSLFSLASIAILAASCTSPWPASEARLLACSFCVTARRQWAQLPTHPLHIIYHWCPLSSFSPSSA